MQILQETEGETAEFAGRIRSSVLALPVLGAVRDQTQPKRDVHRQVPYTIDQDSALIRGRKEEETMVGIVLNDCSPWCLRAQATKTIAVQGPDLFDDFGWRLEAAGVQPDIQQLGVEDLGGTRVLLNRRLYGVRAVLA